MKEKDHNVYINIEEKVFNEVLICNFTKKSNFLSFRAQLFTFSMADLLQNINRVSKFLPLIQWRRNPSIKTLVH